MVTNYLSQIGTITIVVIYLLGGLLVEEGLEADRYISSWDAEEAWSVHDAEYLLNPMFIAESSNHVYVSDFGDIKLKRFDMDGEFINHVGEGRGQGPGEMQMISHFAVSGEHVFITDPTTSRVHHFEGDGSFVGDFSAEGQPLRIAMLDHKMATFSLPPSDVFRLMDREGDIETRFGSEVDERVQNPNSADGLLAPGSDSYLVYAPLYAGKIFVYTDDGELSNIISTVDGHDFQEAAQGSPEDWDVRTNDISIVDDYLYLHTKVRDGDDQKDYVDRYTWPEGEYIDSFEFNQTIRQAHVGQEYIYTIEGEGTSLVAYTYDN